ncbi:hypothetical protein C2W64_04317 [Brevibacillus laterosporus]|nr:hypothetical protein C2W64_04317 [Brevibacillus laterosporus]
MVVIMDIKKALAVLLSAFFHLFKIIVYFGGNQVVCLLVNFNYYHC